jgi:hypothetical protein
MEADNFRLLVQQHCDVLGADIAHHSLRLRYRPQAFCMVMPLHMPSHRLAGLRSKAGLRPERVVDIETAGAQLAKAGDVARSFQSGTDISEKGQPEAVQLLLGHTKLESTVRYLGIEVDDALAISEQVGL